MKASHLSLILTVSLVVLLSSCSGAALPSLTPSPRVSVTVTATEPATETPMAVQTASLTPTTQAPQTTVDWQLLPIVPTVSPEMEAVYQRGLAVGRNPSRFSKIGDCQNITTYFLAEFDNPNEYSLGDQYTSLQSTIDHFSGSWSRESLAVRGGLNVAAALNPLWASTKTCNPGETPIACELRVNNPSLAVISMEESWSGDIGTYDRYMRMIVEYVLSQDVVPILATRAETANPEISINATVAAIANDYHLPLWNFWAAAYPLPSHGLTPDGFHLTWAAPFFDDPQRMVMAWPWRNLTALQAIDAVWRGLNGGH